MYLRSQRRHLCEIPSQGRRSLFFFFCLLTEALFALAVLPNNLQHGSTQLSSTIRTVLGTVILAIAVNILTPL